jgi:hypothetical protein
VVEEMAKFVGWCECRFVHLFPSFIEKVCFIIYVIDPHSLMANRALLKKSYIDRKLAL